jgi:hypothetical protein
MMLHSATLSLELTNGNDGRGSKWFSSAKLRKVIESQLRANGHARSTPFQTPVVIRLTRILGQRQQLWDFSSWGRGNWKEIEDALVEIGWFVDDGPKYITDIRFVQFTPKVRRSPDILVEVFDKWED